MRARPLLGLAIAAVGAYLLLSRTSAGPKGDAEGEYMGLRYRVYWTDAPRPIVLDENNNPVRDSEGMPWRGFFETEGGGHYGAYGRTRDEAVAMVKRMIEEHVG